MSAKLEILAAKIIDELVDIQRVVNRTEEIYQKAMLSNDDAYFDGLALNLHGFYMGVEHIFENIARTLDGVIPSGTDWHKELLHQMSLEVPSVRPPVIQKETRICLDEYLRFRHVVRHGYIFNLRTARVQELASGVRECLTAVTQDLQNFIQFLQQLTR